MKNIFVNSDKIHISEDCFLIDDWKIEKVNIFTEKNVKIFYTHIPLEKCENFRYFSLADGVNFSGNSVLSSDGNHNFITEANGSDVHSTLKILGIAKSGANIAAEGVVRANGGHKKLNMRVDQTNILIGETATIRGIPRLEIATDDIEGGHSCKIHRLGGEALFYLESHGMSAKNAEVFLLNSEILRHIETLPDVEKSEFCSHIHKNILQK